jgi:hypothetical protein
MEQFVRWETASLAEETDNHAALETLVTAATRALVELARLVLGTSARTMDTHRGLTVMETRGLRAELVGRVKLSRTEAPAVAPRPTALAPVRVSSALKTATVQLARVVSRMFVRPRPALRTSARTEDTHLAPIAMETRGLHADYLVLAVLKLIGHRAAPMKPVVQGLVYAETVPQDTSVAIRGHHRVIIHTVNAF